MIAEVDRSRLLRLARHALVARVTGGLAPRPPADLNRPASGVFVTVHHRDDLRGCLGTLDTRELLAAAVVRLAGDVTEHDHRFEPIQAHEIDDVFLDLSVLTIPQLVEELRDIVIGRHGVIVEDGAHKGLLLPQVAIEHGWDRDMLLMHTCLKAGLHADAWRNGATIFCFEAEVFGELNRFTM